MKRAPHLLMSILYVILLVSCSGIASDRSTDLPANTGMTTSSYRSLGAMNEHGDRIYYRFPIDEREILFSCDGNGNDIKEISNSIYGYINIKDDYIYCIGADNDPGIKKINTVTKKKTNINEESDICSLFLYEDVIAYCKYRDTSEQADLYVIIEDKTLPIDTGISPSSLIYNDGYLYYTKWEYPNARLFRYNYRDGSVTEFGEVQGGVYEILYPDIIHSNLSSISLTNFDTKARNELVVFDENTELMSLVVCDDTIIYTTMNNETSIQMLYSYDIQHELLTEYGEIDADPLTVIGNDIYCISYFSGDVKRINIHDGSYSMQDILTN